MVGQIGLGIFVIGTICLFLGGALLMAGKDEEAGIETRWGAFVGPSWFIFMSLGIVLMIFGWMMPI